MMTQTMIYYLRGPVWP